MTFRFIPSSRLAALGALLAAASPLSVFAQTQQPDQSIAIAFAAAEVASVPVGGWASGVLALLLVGLTAFLWKRKGIGRALRAFALAAAAGLASLSALEVREAQAAEDPGYPIDLLTSPTFTEMVESLDYTATNRTGRAIVLTAVSENINSYDIDPVGTTCTVGKRLEAGASCLIVLRGLAV